MIELSNRLIFWEIILKLRTKRILKKSAMVAVFFPAFIAFNIMNHELDHCVIGSFCGYPENTLSAADLLGLSGIGFYLFLLIYIPLWLLIFLVWFWVEKK